jgi:hypothetical protein
MSENGKNNEPKSIHPTANDPNVGAIGLLVVGPSPSKGAGCHAGG